MVRYELKKMFGTFGGKIALFLYAAIVLLSCWLAATGALNLGTDWVNEQGEHETGISAIRKMRSAQNEWEGYLDQETLTRVIQENARINATPEGQSKNAQKSDIAFGWKQGFIPIRELINRSYASGFRSYDYYRTDGISVIKEETFYANRINLLKDWLYDKTDVAYDLYSEAEKQYIISQYEEFSDGRVLSTAYKRPQTKSGHEWWKYVYDEHFDCIICPEYQVLNYSTTNRDGYQEYKSDPKVCANCPTRHLCTKNKDCIKTVTRHIWAEYVELADDARYTPIYQRMYKARKETIERVFADAKEQHGMRYTRYTGLAQVANWVKLKFAAMNLKKFANRLWKDTHSGYVSFIISIIYPRYVMNPCLA